MTERTLLLQLIDEAYDQPSPHGPNLRNVLRGVRAADAVRRTAADTHSIWELVLHCAYWKFVATRRLSGTKVRFPRKGTNFFALPEAAEENWRADLGLLQECHERFREAVATASTRKIAEKSRTIRMVPMHDLYHAGQIRLMVRMGARNPTPNLSVIPHAQ